MNIHEFDVESKPTTHKNGNTGLMSLILARKEVYVSILIFLTGISSFFLGRLSVEERTPPVRIDYLNNIEVGTVKGESVSLEDTPQVILDEPSSRMGTQASDGMYVGSKNSNKFHLPWCSGAKQIAEENRIWFQTKEEALAKGYLPAANCKGI